VRHRSDNNQKQIIKALELIGCSVYVIGRPTDLLVGLAKKNYLLECKSKAGIKTPFQKEFFKMWQGQVQEVRSPQQAIQVVTQSYGRQGD